MRYLIDDQDLDIETSFKLYQTILAWAANRADRFVLNLQPAIYDNPNDVAQLRRLGVVKAAPYQTKGDFFSRLLAKIFSKPAETIQVEGTPDEVFIRELTRIGAPPRAVSGDVCPVEDVMTFIGERILYAVYEYGRDQVLDLTDEELESLQEVLNQAGFESKHIISVPPSIS